jgi:hypothetical protein
MKNRCKPTVILSRLQPLIDKRSVKIDERIPAVDFEKK